MEGRRFAGISCETSPLLGNNSVTAGQLPSEVSHSFWGDKQQTLKPWRRLVCHSLNGTLLQHRENLGVQMLSLAACLWQRKWHQTGGQWRLRDKTGLKTMLEKLKHVKVPCHGPPGVQEEE